MVTSAAGPGSIGKNSPYGDNSPAEFVVVVYPGCALEDKTLAQRNKPAIKIRRKLVAMVLMVPFLFPVKYPYA